MKPLYKIFLGAVFLCGFQFATSGCVADGYVSGRAYYGPHRDPWFRDDRWMDGNRGYGERRGGSVDVYIAPPRIILPPVIRVR